MMKQSLKDQLAGLFLKENIPFTTKREIDWGTVKKCAGLSLGVGLFVLLLLPTPTPEQTVFHERADGRSDGAAAVQESDPTQDALSQLQQEKSLAETTPRNMDRLYQGGSAGQSSNDDRSASMILNRTGQDSRNQTPAGSQISVRLTQKVFASGQPVPVIGIVSADFVHEGAVAVPQGSKIFGEVSFDEGSDRARIDLKAIQLADGRERQISAVGVGRDGQTGVDGKIHSEALKNTLGQTLTRFVGAYAAGSMQRGALGSNEGGSDNGWKNAIAETAKDRAENWAEDLKKEKRWVELSSGAEFSAVLTQGFTFRDPGAMNGR